jgi:hypothetical protein
MDYEDMIASLNHHEIINLLFSLCSDDEHIKDRVVSLIMERFQSIDVESIAEQVFGKLNSIDVRDLWDRSGETYYGYSDPSEEASLMIEEAIEPFVQRLKDCRRYDMEKEEEMYCQAICAGLVRYESSGTNEFHGWVPDDPRTIADNLYYDWRDKNKKKEWSTIHVKEMCDL